MLNVNDYHFIFYYAYFVTSILIGHRNDYNMLAL